MTRKPQTPTPWREQRQRHGRTQDYKKKARANRERFRRAKKGIFKRANDIFVDSQDNGYDRRVYVLLVNKRPSGIHYSTYDSHPKENWVPAPEDVGAWWPAVEKWTPPDFDEQRNTRTKPQQKVLDSNHLSIATTTVAPHKILKISEPPLLYI